MDIKTTINCIINGDSVVSTRKELVDLKLQQERELKMNLYLLDRQKEYTVSKLYHDKVQFIDRYYYLCDKAKSLKDTRKSSTRGSKQIATGSKINVNKSLNCLPDILQKKKFRPTAFGMIMLRNRKPTLFKTLMKNKVILDYDDLVECRYLRIPDTIKLPPL